MKFLKFDSPFMIRYRMIADYFLLGLLWVIVSVPIITFGAATTAMLQTVEHTIREHDLKFGQPFFQRFRKEFKQSTILWLIELVILAVLVFYAVIVYKSGMAFVLKALIFFVMALVFMWVHLWHGYASKIQDDVRTVMLNCLRITLANMGISVLRLLTVAVAVLGLCLGLLYFEPAVLVIPGIYVMLDSLLLRKLFKKYLPEEEIEEPEDEFYDEMVEAID